MGREDGSGKGVLLQLISIEWFHSTKSGSGCVHILTQFLERCDFPFQDVFNFFHQNPKYMEQ